MYVTSNISYLIQDITIKDNNRIHSSVQYRLLWTTVIFFGTKLISDNIFLQNNNCLLVILLTISS